MPAGRPNPTGRRTGGRRGARPSPGTTRRGRRRATTATWYDRERTASAASGLSGLEFLQALVDGRLPPAPLVMLLGFRAVEAEAGRGGFAGTPGERGFNAPGCGPGGV